MTPRQMGVPIKNPHRLNSTSLSSFLSSSTHFHLRGASLYELNEEHFKDKMNQPLTLLYLPPPCLSLSETVNRINWLCVLEVGLETHTHTHTYRSPTVVHTHIVVG